MTACEPGLRAAFALGGTPLVAAFIGTLFVGIFLGLYLAWAPPRDPYD
jgi:hypothetical protein